MKKYKLILLFLFLIGIKSKAGEIVPVTFGPFVSMTSTSLTAKPDFVNQLAGSGFNIGALVRLKLLFLYAQGEASFGSRSASATVNDMGLDSNVTFKLKGLDLSALVGLKLFSLGDYGNFRIFGGYNWNNYTDIFYSVNGNSLGTSNVNKNNHSVVGGFGIDLFKLTFDLKFINGFIDISKLTNISIRSRVVNLTVAYRFR